MRLQARGGRPLTILVAEDDEHDRVLTREAMVEAHVVNEIRFVKDGEELMDYLTHRGEYGEGKKEAPRPGIILLDLNMPRKDGREALAEISSAPDLASIPVVVLTTSKAEEDIVRTYELGVNSFITKPVTFSGLADALKAFAHYWFHIVELPPRE